MGRIYQVDYERAFALCSEMERHFEAMEGQGVQLQGLLESVASGWLPHGAIVRAYGEGMVHRIRGSLGESRANIASLRQALLSLKALEEEQARRMRSARAR
ncbi:hypothetical protein HRbin22_01365 [Candidatus Thermoflexus japonica]|uniref:Uncharacterized protein n=1 Tax=Candidatus Thermoflexus japonica TaxID=2035417 RepID=A0A2H5Y6X5_9CHLR|nr:hypothetical protein HRbin22_01365 [Candidatus Thermoflexus japonica]